MICNSVQTTQHVFMCGVVHLEHLKNRWNRDTCTKEVLWQLQLVHVHIDASSGNCKSNEPDTGIFLTVYIFVLPRRLQVGTSVPIWWVAVFVLLLTLCDYVGRLYETVFRSSHVIQHCVGITPEVCWRCVVGVHDQVFGWNSKQAAIEAYHRVCVHLAGFALLTLFDYSRVLHFK